MNLENLGLLELNAQEVQEVDGGLTVMEMIQMAWDATPDGYNSNWSWQTNGSWGYNCFWWGESNVPC